MHYFYDKNNIRYNLVSTNGGKPINWIFIPGGPGGDSSYFLGLTELLQCLGNTWLVDFPGNGNHNVQKDGFDNWLSIFVPMVKQFQNPVIVGHSFGGILPLLYNEMEDLLKGLVIIDSTPSLWLEEAAKFATDHNLPDLTKEMTEFTINPNQDTFSQALNACTPYYFPPKTLEYGRKLLKSLPFAFEAAVWWQRKAIETSYNASWIPQNVKTLIIGGEFDAITPFSLFEKDERFNRKNIERILVKNAGHLPWIEEPEKVRKIIKKFEADIL
jgi:pimeloyl-ACP methyl ester carboxylesterase